MANSTVTVTVTKHYADGRALRVFGTIAIGAGDYPAGGLTLPLNSANIKSPVTRQPYAIRINGQSGYVYTYIPGSDRSNGKLMVYQSAGSAAPLAQVATTTPNGVVSDTITFDATFSKFK